MNILNINLPKCHFYTLIELVKSGHNVWTTWEESSLNYEPSFGIKYIPTEDNNTINYNHLNLSEENKKLQIKTIEKLIDKYKIDCLQVAIPTMAYLHTHFADKVKYIGPPEHVARLETNKLFAKEKAKELGLRVPSILKQGKWSDPDYLTTITFPCIEKPSYVWSPATIFTTQWDIQLARDQIIGKFGPRGEKDLDYYIEEYIDDMIETNVFFVIANGEYSITHTQQIIGENLNKTVATNVWYFGSYIKPLKPEVDILVRQQAEIYLAEIAKMGGSWEGSFCGAYTSSNEWYFLEINVRPDIFNSTPTFMTGDDYLKGMFQDVSLFGAAWASKNVQKLLIISNRWQEPYPVDLHLKHNVKLPNNLEIGDDGNYYICLYGITDHDPNNPKQGAGTIITDHNIPDEFKKDIEELEFWKFNEDPDL